MNKRIDIIEKVFALVLVALACIFNPDAGTPLLFCLLLCVGLIFLCTCDFGLKRQEVKEDE